MEWLKYLLEKEISFHRIGTIIVLIVIITMAIMGIVTFLKPYYDNILFFSISWLTIEVIVIAFWYYKRTTFPKGNPRKQNLVIAITTEDVSQKVRITKDFANQIKKQLLNYGLSDQYDVLVLHNHLSKRAQELINGYIISINAKLTRSEHIDSFNNVSQRMQAKFIVYGDLIKRDAPDSKYYLSIEAFIRHAEPNNEQKRFLKEEFDKQWKNEIEILEKDELNGFKSNAENIFFISTYMLGLATFVDNRFLQGILIWERLEQFILKNESVKEFMRKVIQLKSASYILQSTLDYYLGNIERSILYKEKLLAITPNDYESHLIQAIKQVNLRNRADLALKHIEKAKELAGDNGTWRYSQFYLQIRLEKFQDSLFTLDEILGTTFESELDTVSQVITYNEHCLKKDGEHIQTHLIVGVFYYKKLNQPVLAYERLDQFVDLTSADDKWKLLRNRANEYLEELNPILGIK